MMRTPAMNLQLFAAGEKTEKATAKKKRDARKKGQVVQSRDLTTAVIFLAVMVTINMTTDYYTTRVIAFYRLVSDLMTETEGLFSFGNIIPLFQQAIEELIVLILPVLMVALATGLLLSFLQVGALFTTETLKFKLDKINPISGFKKLFSLRSLVELVKSLLKGGILVAVVLNYLFGRQGEILSVLDLSVAQIAALMWELLFGVGVRAAAVLLALAVLDYAYKVWQNEKDLRMSKKEIKDEYKESEGDPLLKSKIKEKQRQFAMSRMMQEVPEADVIITNPTHFAVAVRYDLARAQAPVVVAKGQDLVAMNIKKIGGENDVPIVENKPLARSLYDLCDLGDLVPPDLYEAVAEVLAYVYRLKN